MKQKGGSKGPAVRFSALHKTSSTRETGGSKSGGDEVRHRRSPGIENAQARSLLPGLGELKWIDQFAYYPTYRYYSYRSLFGALCSIFVVSTFLLRMISSTSDFSNRPPVVTEAREQFPRDSTEQHVLPRVGVQFRQNGWLPFNDPRYISIAFDQGVIHRSGNVTYTDLGSKVSLPSALPCAQSLRPPHTPPARLPSTHRNLPSSSSKFTPNQQNPITWMERAQPLQV